MPDLEQLLKAAPIPDSVRADAWDAYHAAVGPQELAARLQKLPLDQATKANLWDAKNAATPPVDLRPRNYGGPPPEDPPEKQGMFRSFYETAIKPTIDLVKDAYNRNDMGEHAAGEILDSFKEQVKNFAGHPDIRNLPIIGTGATATAARMQKQFDAGNYTGMIGSAAGFIAPFATPAAIESAPGAASAVGQTVKTAAKAVRNVLPDGPIVSPVAADIVGAVHAPAGFALRSVNRAGAIANKILGPKTAPAAALSPGDQVLANMRASSAAQAAEDAAYENLPTTFDKATNARLAEIARKARPAYEGLTLPGESPAPSRPAAAATPLAVRTPVAAPVPDQYTAQPEDFQKSWEPGPAGTPAPAQPWAPYQADARDSLPPELVAKVDELRAATHPDANAAQMLEDFLAEHHAYKAMQAQDAEWGNRAASADRFAEFLTRNKLEPTPANIAKAARELVKDPPSADTVDMIHDRMGYTAPGAEPAASPSASEPAPTDLEQKLADSVAAANAKREAKAAESAPSTIDARAGSTAQSEGAPDALAGRNPQGTSNNPQDRGGASAAARRAGKGDETTVNVPGDNKTYQGRYAVRELTDLIPSHNGVTFERNPAYAYENDRDYSNPVNQERVVVNSRSPRFDPRYLINDNPDATNGPPLVEQAGHVLGGNNRTMMLQRVYNDNPGGAAAYRDRLMLHADRYGIDRRDIAGMKQPVLIRELDPLTGGQQAGITDFNKSGTAALTQAERATADARSLGPDVAHYIGGAIEQQGPDATLNDALSGKDGIKIIDHLVDSGVFTMQEKPNLIDSKTGAVTAAAKERISKMLLGQLFRTADQMQNIAPALRGKLERVVAPILRSQEKPAWNLLPTVQEAIDLLSYADAHGMKNLDDAIAQDTMFGEAPKFSPAAVDMAKQLKAANPNDLTKKFRAYMTDSVPTMFGESTPAEAFREHFSTAAAKR